MVNVNLGDHFVDPNILDGRPLFITREGYNQLVRLIGEQSNCNCWKCQAGRMLPKHQSLPKPVTGIPP